jgi:hypothetical protein
LLLIWFEACYAWKICFYVKKILFIQKKSFSMILMASGHIYFLIFITCPCSIYIYILLALCQNPLDIEFSIGFQSFWNCWGSFQWTCLAPGPDMSGSWVSQLYKGDPVTLGTLASFFHPISSVCSDWALPRRFEASSTKTPRFLGDLTPLLLWISKPYVVLSLLWYSQCSPLISLIYCWFC